MKYGTIIILNMHVWGITKSIKNERSEICSPTFTDSKSLINDNFNFTCFFFRHSERMINKLETAGLGYHVNVANTYEKIG